MMPSHMEFQQSLEETGKRVSIQFSCRCIDPRYLAMAECIFAWVASDRCQDDEATDNECDHPRKAALVSRIILTLLKKIATVLAADRCDCLVFHSKREIEKSLLVRLVSCMMISCMMMRDCISFC